MTQSDQYKYIARTDYIADLVGADVAEDILNTVVKRVEDPVDITDRPGRTLGQVSLGGVDGTLAVEQQSPVGVENSGGAQVDPATEGTVSALAGALGANAADSLRVSSPGPLDVSAATVPVEQQTELDANVTNSDEGAGQGVAVAASTGVTLATLAGSGAQRLVGQVVSSGSYDLAVEWLAGAGGAVVRTESIASGVVGGTWTDIDVPARSPYCNVVVTDTSAAAQTADFTVHMT